MLASDVALEVSGDGAQRRLSVRGAPAAVRQAIDQLHHVYPDLETRPLPAEADPARRLPVAAAQTALALRPGRAAFLSLKTWREFEGNDPLTPILAALADLAPGESGLAQVIVHGAAQANWADRHLRDLNVLRRRVVGGQGAPDLKALLIAILTFVLMIAPLLMFYGPVLFCFGLVALGARHPGRAGAPRWRDHARGPAQRRATALEAEAEIKLREQAFRTSLRIYAGAATPERAALIADRLARAYQLFNTTSGNHLAIAPAVKGADPQRLAPDKGGDATLSVREVAGLWHIPVGAHHVMQQSSSARSSNAVALARAGHVAHGATHRRGAQGAVSGGRRFVSARAAAQHSDRGQAPARQDHAPGADGDLVLQRSDALHGGARPAR